MQAAAALGGALRVVVRAGHCGQGLEVVRRAGLVPASAARDSPSVRCSAAPLRSPQAWLLSARSYSEMRMDSRSDARRAAVRPLVNGRAATSGSPLVSRTCPRKLYTWATASARKYAACRSCAPAQSPSSRSRSSAYSPDRVQQPEPRLAAAGLRSHRPWRDCPYHQGALSLRPVEQRWRCCGEQGCIVGSEQHDAQSVGVAGGEVIRADGVLAAVWHLVLG